MTQQLIVEWAQDEFGVVDLTPNAPAHEQRRYSQVPDWLRDRGMLQHGTDEVPPDFQDHRNLDNFTNLGDWGEDLGNSVSEPTTIEAMAFYAPFHSFRVHWGIHYLSSRIYDHAQVLKGAHLTPHDPWIKIAFSEVRHHELTHYYSELAATRAEMLNVAPLYEPYSSSGFIRAHEEAVANARAYRKLQKSGAPTYVLDRVADGMRRSPPGYRDFDMHLSDTAYRGAQRMIVLEQLRYRGGRTLMGHEPVGFVFSEPRTGAGYPPEIFH